MRAAIGLAAGLIAAVGVTALGEPRVVTFPEERTDSQRDNDQVVFTNQAGSDSFLIASKHGAAPLLLDSKDNVAVHIAAQTWAEDVRRVTGAKPDLYNDTLPLGVVKPGRAVIVGTADSRLIRGVTHRPELKGKWEAYDARVVDAPLDGVDEALVITGSDRRGTIFALYTLSEQMGVSPWLYWSDVPVRHRDAVGFTRDAVLAHGEPTVKYRGIFINDEHPALWGWAQTAFKKAPWEPAFQTEFYAPWFEMMLRLKANYAWPAMYISSFRVDGMDVSSGLPEQPIPGPNLALADAMGIVMGSSHHEPMERNKPEWDAYGSGKWDWTNNATLKEFWRYGAERARDMDVLYTMGMRGDGDMPLTGASLELVQNITAAQLEILRDVYGDDVSNVPKMWAMYKEVAEYYVDGLEIPPDVSILFADDNFGNIMSVVPPERPHAAGGGIYYHVDYVGFPRAYKWINTINMAKTWEQMNIARAFNTTTIWMLNVGSLKPLELPTEQFLALAYDFDAWPLNSLDDFLRAWAARDFGDDVADEVADIMATYSVYASRRKPEMYNSTMWSLINYREAERILDDWEALTKRAEHVYHGLPAETQPAFFQLVYMLCLMQTNINKMHIAVGRSNHYAWQSRNRANHFAHAAIDAFYQDANLTETFHSLLGRRWDHMLDQTHMSYDSHLEPDRDHLPPISFVNPHQSVRGGIPVPELTLPRAYSTRVTVENSYGAWPGWTLWNCDGEGKCPDPTLYTLDPYGAPDRWVDIGSSGPRTVHWRATPSDPWLKVSQRKGKLTSDATNDVRLYVSVDWKKAPSGTSTSSLLIQSSDGANVTVTVPITVPHAPPSDFTGFVEGDGYVVMDAAHFQRRKATDEHALEVIKGYGRHGAGVSMFPVDTANYTVGTGPRVEYDFWVHGDAGVADKDSDVEVTVQIGPGLNFLLGKELAFGFQWDKTAAREIHPIPTDRLGPQYSRPGMPGLYVGAVPSDWPEIVRTENRNVTLHVPRAEVDAGAHTISLFGMTPGIVFERIWVDLGGLQQRGYSYLGPPESMRLNVPEE